MELKKSKQSRRFGILTNINSLIAIILLFECIRIGIIPKSSLVFELIPLFFLLFSYFIFFAKTGLWNFTHKSQKDLDEREIQLSNKSLRFSYLIFTISSLSIFVLYNILGISINMVLIASLIYLAHILPSYFIAWTEESVFENE